MSDLTTILAEVIGIVKDDSGKLVNPTDYDRAIAAALLTYSRHKPLELIEDIAGDGSDVCVLPATWSPEFSTVRSVEYPIDEKPRVFLERGDYEVTQRAGTMRLSFELEETESIRVTFTGIRTGDDVADIDVQAFNQLAAAYCLEMLANIHAQSSDSTINADVVNYRTKSGEFAARAKRAMQLYKDHMGIKENDSAPAASASADFDLKYPGGEERLTHRRSSREQR
jgi:hypothetical protein